MDGLARKGSPQICNFVLPTRCALPRNAHREGTATNFRGRNTTAQFFQDPLQTSRWRAILVPVRSSRDRSRSAGHALADRIQMKSNDALDHCLTALNDQECRIWS